MACPRRGHHWTDNDRTSLAIEASTLWQLRMDSKVKLSSSLLTGPRLVVGGFREGPRLTEGRFSRRSRPGALHQLKRARVFPEMECSTRCKISLQTHAQPRAGEKN